MLKAVSFITLCCLAVASSADDAFFEKEVRPLLVKHCYKCHNGLKSNGGLALDTRVGWQKGGESGPAIVAGKPDESLLIRAVKHSSLKMPPEGEGEKLSEAEIAVLSRWIESGAHDPRVETAKLGGMRVEEAQSWWAFQPLPSLNTSDISRDIDDFIDAKIAEQSLTANPPADRPTLIRRASYDLTGLPPTPDEVDAFESDPSDDAFARMVDRLLESPQYGVKWGRHWLDVARYADTAGENTDRPLPHAWRYRNWVIDAMNRDLPFDQFVKSQLAGDIIHRDGTSSELKEGITATGYLAIARRFGHDIDKDIHLMYEDVIDNVGKNFLGLSIGCARCHDHKYDAITAEDYYALYGIFSSTRFAFPGCEAKGQPKDLVPLIPQAEADELISEWRERIVNAEAEKKKREKSAASIRNRAKESTSKSTHVLAEATIAKAGSASFPASAEDSPIRVTMRKGEVLQLVVAPNGNHGADSTLVEWEITQHEGEGKWNVNEVVPNLLEGNPHSSGDGASWCFLDVTDGPSFLNDKKGVVDGQSDLNSWSSGDVPSVFVNRSNQAIKVWTLLPPKAFFVHPGIERLVAVAWICPIDGVVKLTGRVSDAHPSGGNGVACRLEHIASPDIGPALVKLGTAPTSPEVTIEPAPTFPVAYAVAESTPTNARLQTRGDPEKLDDFIPRRWLSIFGGEAIPDGARSGRRQLADWISEHPLAARVMVNRIWTWHFGRGLVASPNDFGSRGESPTHPELLDWLAVKFRDSGYSIKTMHRLIMNSDAYHRSSAISENSIDVDNRYLGRFARRRLNAEEIRDSLLWISGALDTSPAEAHPFPPEANWTFTQHNPFSAIYDTNRRSAYLMVARQRRDPYLAAFDGADPNASTAVRPTTTVPTQALYFMNAPLLHTQAAGFAKRIMVVVDERERVETAFRLAYQREPTTDEQKHVSAFLTKYPGNEEEKWAAYTRVLLASNEFLYLD